MAIYECRIMFMANSSMKHHSPTRNPANTNLCGGYSFWTPSTQGGGSSFNNGSLADHRHMQANTDTLTVVLYDISNTIRPNTSVSGVINFRSKYIGAGSQSPISEAAAPVAGTFQAGPTGSPYPFAYIIVPQGWPVANVGDYDFSATFTVNGVTFFIDPEMNVDPGGGK